MLFRCVAYWKAPNIKPPIFSPDLYLYIYTILG